MTKLTERQIEQIQTLQNTYNISFNEAYEWWCEDTDYMESGE